MIVNWLDSQLKHTFYIVRSQNMNGKRTTNRESRSYTPSIDSMLISNLQSDSETITNIPKLRSRPLNKSGCINNVYMRKEKDKRRNNTSFIYLVRV